MSQKSTTVRILRGVAGVTSRLAPGLAARWLEHLFLTPRNRTRTSTEREWLWRSSTEELVDVHGRSFRLHLWGDGPTVLLVHGWAGRGSQLWRFVEPLVERGYRVATFDAPAHGEDHGGRSSLADLADAIARTVAHLGGIEGIVAHSLGSAATTLAASRGVDVGRLVYVAPPERLPDYLERVARFLGFSEDVTRRTRGRIEQRVGFGFDEIRGTRLGPTLDVPLLVVHDRGDREVPWEEGRDLAGAWPGALLKTTEGLGHHRILADEAVVAFSVAFLVPPESDQLRLAS